MENKISSNLISVFPPIVSATSGIGEGQSALLATQKIYGKLLIQMASLDQAQVSTLELSKRTTVRNQGPVLFLAETQEVAEHRFVDPNKPIYFLEYNGLVGRFQTIKKTSAVGERVRNIDTGEEFFMLKGVDKEGQTVFQLCHDDDGNVYLVYKREDLSESTGPCRLGSEYVKDGKIEILNPDNTVSVANYDPATGVITMDGKIYIHSAVKKDGSFSLFSPSDISINGKTVHLYAPRKEHDGSISIFRPIKH